jgi:hypothetical protein
MLSEGSPLVALVHVLHVVRPPAHVVDGAEAVDEDVVVVLRLGFLLKLGAQVHDVHEHVDLELVAALASKGLSTAASRLENCSLQQQRLARQRACDGGLATEPRSSDDGEQLLIHVT